MSKSLKPGVSGIDYQELEIEVAQCLCGEGEVRILGSPFDRPREPFRPPFDLDELNDLLEELDSLQLKTDARSVDERKNLAQKVGQTLYQALLPGKVRQTFGNSLAALRMLRASKRVGLRLRLSFGQANRYLSEIVALPWELLCSPDTLEFPVSAPETPLVRYLDLERPIEPITIQPPVRVLAVLASPRGLREIDREHHANILRTACPGGGCLKLEFLEPATLAELCEVLEGHRDAGEPIHVIHFLGHGAFGEDGEGYLNFERDDGGRNEVSGRVLAQTISGFREIRLAVLSTCVGARMMRHRGQHPFAGAASALVAGGLPAVVAMQFPVSEQAASEFTGAFYRGLSKGRPLEEAVTEGRLRILATEPRTFEWASPVLFLRSRDGRVLDLVDEHGQAQHEQARGPAAPSRTSDDTTGRDLYKAYIIQKAAGDSVRVGRDINVGSAGRDVNIGSGNR